MSIKTESIKRVIRLDGLTPESTTVWLSPSREARAFHCQSCGAFMFNRQHRIIAIIQADMSQELDSSCLEIRCHRCGHKYFVNIV